MTIGNTKCRGRTQRGRTHRHIQFNYWEKSAPEHVFNQVLILVPPAIDHIWLYDLVNSIIHCLSNTYFRPKVKTGSSPGSRVQYT